MSDLYRLRVTWGGAPVVGEGLSTFYFSNVDSSVPAAVAGFFNDIKNQIPGGVSWQVPNSGDVLNDANGVITGSWVAGTSSTVTSVVSATWVQGVGARVVWSTDGIVAGRRVKGSTFIVPILTEKFTSGGAIDDSMVSQFDLAAEDMLDALTGTLNMVVWSRPTTSRTGSSHVVGGAHVPDKVSWLRSRRT